MCRAMEDMRNQTMKEGMKEVALRMLAAGKYALKEVVSISGLSLEEVKQLKADRSAQATLQSRETKNGFSVLLKINAHLNGYKKGTNIL